MSAIVGKSRWVNTLNHNKNKKGDNFQFTEFTIKDFFFARYTAKIGQWQIFQLSIFVLSREKCHY